MKKYRVVKGMGLFYLYREKDSTLIIHTVNIGGIQIKKYMIR